MRQKTYQIRFDGELAGQFLAGSSEFEVWICYNSGGVLKLNTLIFLQIACPICRTLGVTRCEIDAKT